jgi:FixJ family two-component response regulator
VIAGKRNKVIASEIGTTEKTVKVHRGRIMEKMKVRSVAELVRAADKLGIKPAPAAPRTGGKTA